MKPESPVIPEQNLPEVIVAEHQDEYQNLPSIYISEKILLCRWSMTDEEKQIVAETGKIFLLLWTFGRPAPFVTMQVEIPKLVGAETEKEVENSINGENDLRFEVKKYNEGFELLTWTLSNVDREIVSSDGNVYLFMKTDGKPVTPMLMQVDELQFQNA